jgi:tetratricopeptide (TPR) repeat protein
MKHDTTFEKIEAWLDGKLPATEVRALEAEIAADPALAAEVRKRRIARMAIDRLVEQDFEQNIAKWRYSMGDPPPPPPDPFWKLWMTIPLALIAALAVWYFWPNPQTAPVRTEEVTPPPHDSSSTTIPTPPTQPTPPPVDKSNVPVKPRYIALADQKLHDYRATVLTQYGKTMGDSGTGNRHFEEGVLAFRQNKNAAAKKALLQVPATDADHYIPAQEMLAWIFYQEGNYAEAAWRYETFVSLLPGPDADWYLLLFYLADYEKRKTDFQKLLDEMLDPANEHKRRDDAEMLKRGMEEKK